MRLQRRNLLKDRKGVSNTAVALLTSIIVLLVYNAILNMPNGPELLFYLLFLFLRTIGVVGDDFGQFVEWVRGTPVWPLLTLIGSQIGMVLSVAVTFAVTWWTVGITTKILAWRRARREGKRKIREKKDKEYRLWKKRLEGEDEEPSVVLPKLIKANWKPKSRTLITTGRISKAGKSIHWRDLTRIEWWQIPKTQVLTLVEGKLKEMILDAKKLYPTERSPQGSYRELGNVLGIDYRELRSTVKEGRDSMTIENVLKLLDILKASYDILTPYIKSVGGRSHKEAIMNPKFPIDLNNPYGARLLAAALNDGWITRSQQYFTYANYNTENLRIVTEAVQSIFGNIEPTPLYDQEGKQKGIQFTSAVIGEALLRAGGVEGRKTEQDFGLPPMIAFGDYTIRNAFFEQAIRDDGRIDYKRHLVYICNAQEMESKFMLEHYRTLEQLSWEVSDLPSKTMKLYLNITRELKDQLPDELKPFYEDFISKMRTEWVPTILKEEAQIMEKIYGITVRIDPIKIYKGEKRGLRGEWHLIVDEEKNFEKIVKQLDLVWEKGGDENR